ncbi:Inosine-5'-monophosphate dehydrogenase [uncultured Eubacterium sp.]|nr:Inosine-5'-monophosphate dehydrogenase [uncultured Eubacterium sp.]
MTVKELMTTSVCFLKPDASISDAAALMKKNNIGIVPICDNRGCLLGLVTDRDILMRVSTADAASVELTKISDIMTTNLVTISPEMNVHDAACLFSKKKVHRLPVLENGRLVGMLSLTDLAKKKIFLAEVGDIMGAIAAKK